MNNFALTIFFMLITLCDMPHTLLPGHEGNEAIVMCDPDFSFITTACSQSVSFQATAPIPLSNPNLSFEWDFGDGSSGMGVNVDHTYTAFGAGSTTFTVTLTVIDATDGCSNSIQKTIIIDELPDASLTDNNLFCPFCHCDGDTYTLEVNNTSATTSENSNYHIDWGDGSMPFTADQSFTTTSHPYNEQGSYSIVLTVTGTNGCTNTFHQEFYMGGNPAVGISIPSLGNICNSTQVAVNMENWENNSPGTMYIVTSNSSPNPLFTYEHPPPAVVNVNFSNSSCGFTSVGNFPDAFHVTVEAINPCGNASATAEPVRVSSPPSAAIQATAPDNSCPEQEFEFCDVSFGANYYISSAEECTEVVTRTWSISPSTFSLIGSTFSDSCLTVSFDVPDTYYVCLDVQNPCGTSSICDTVVIAETPIANVQVNSDTGDCAPKTITFENLSQHQISSQWMISPLIGWSGDLNTSSPTITFTDAGVYEIQLTITNPCGTDEWETTIEIFDVPSGGILPISNICEGEQIMAMENVNENGCAVTYNWSFPGGIPNSFIGAIPPPVSYPIAGQYSVTLESTNCCGTTMSTEMFSVTGITTASASAALPNGTCAPAAVELSSQAQNSTSEEWTITPSTGWNGDLNLPDPSITILEVGSYTFSYVAEGGCGSVVWDTAIVFQALPSDTVDFEKSICVGESITPIATSSDNGCPTTYIWSFPGGTPATFTGLNPPSITYNESGQYSVTLESTNCCGITTSTDIVNVTGLTTATATATLPNGTCATAIVELSSQAQNSTSEEWTITPSTGWSGNINLPNPAITIMEVGSYTFAYIAEGGCGSVIWDTMIVFQALPSDTINFEKSICVGESITPIATSSDNGCTTTYIWSFPGGMPATFTGLNPPSITYNESGQYSVTLESTNCCGITTSTDIVNVTGLTTASATATLPNGTCVPATVELSSQAQNSTSEEWTITPSTGWSGNINLPNPAITIMEVGSYTFSYIAEGGCGSVIWDTMIVFQALPAATIIFENDICVGETITPIADILENGCVVTDIEWAFPGGVPSSFIGAVPPQILYNGSGPNTFSVTVSNCCGSTTFSETVEVEDFVTISVTDTIETCVGDTCISLMGIPDNCDWVLDGNVLVNNEFCPDIVGTFDLVYICGSANCPSFDTTTIVVNDLPSITNVPSDITICNNDAPITLSAMPDNENTWWIGNGIDSAGVFNAGVPGSGGTMTYYHEDPITGCINTIEVEITVNEPTVLNVANATFCNINLINLEDEFGIMEATGESITWTGNGITNSENGTFVLPANTNLPADFTIFFNYSNTFNCNYMDSVVITIDPVEQADAGVDTTLCSEGTYQLIGNFGTSDGMWDSLDSTLSVTPSGLVNLEDPSIPLGETTFTFTYTAFDGTTCEVSDSVTLTIINLAGADAGDDLYFCANQTTAVLSPGSVPLENNGEWSGPGIIDSVLGILDLSVIPVDSFITLTYTVSSSTLNSCTSTDEIDVFLTSPPVIDFSYSTPPCVDVPVNFDNQTTGATQYFWSYGDGNTSEEVSSSHTYTYMSSDTFTIIQEAWSIHPLSGDLLCVSIDSQMIIIPPVPEIELLVSTFNGCDSTTIYFDGTTISGGGNFELMVDTEVFTNEIPDSVVIAQAADTFDILISLGVADDCYPTNADTSITIPSAFNANFALQDFNSQTFIFCPPYEANFVNLSTGTIDSFIVKYDNGQFSNNEFTPQIYDNSTDSLLTYQVELILFNNLCLPDTATLELTILPYQFEADLQTLQVLECEGEESYFIAQVSPWIDTITFNPGNGLGSFAVMAGDTIKYVYPQGGNFQATLFASDGCGEIFDTSQITILNGPNLDLIMDSQACVNQEINVAIIPDAPILNPELIFPDTTTYDVIANYTPTMGGILTVEATALDSVSLCPDTISKTITINEYSGIPIEMQAEEKCDEVLVSLGTPIDYIIIDNDIVIEPGPDDTSKVLSFQEAGIHFLEFIKIDEQGCEDSQIISVESVENIIEVDAGIDTSVFLGKTIELQGIVEDGIAPIQINWIADNNENEIFSPYRLITEIKPIYSGFYTLEVEDANGCSASDKIYVFVKQPVCNGLEEDNIFVPNAFTPNNDGKNEVFLVYASKNVTRVTSLQVFDRWGQIMFSKEKFPPNDPQYGWDGTRNGTPINPAVFVWFIEVRLINGEKYICHGDVTLIR